MVPLLSRTKDCCVHSLAAPIASVRFTSLKKKIQVQEQLRHLFDVDPPFVKRNIEDLINKDYLHRLEGREPGKEGYKYVA